MMSDKIDGFLDESNFLPKKADACRKRSRKNYFLRLQDGVGYVRTCLITDTPVAVNDKIDKSQED